MFWGPWQPLPSRWPLKPSHPCSAHPMDGSAVAQANLDVWACIIRFALYFKYEIALAGCVQWGATSRSCVVSAIPCRQAAKAPISTLHPLRGPLTLLSSMAGKHRNEIRLGLVGSLGLVKRMEPKKRYSLCQQSPAFRPQRYEHQPCIPCGNQGH